MEVRHTVSRFPGTTLALILGLAAALAIVMTLSIGGWGLNIPGPSSAASQAAQPVQQGQPGSPATDTRPTTQAGAPVTTGPPCTWGPGCSASP